MSITQSNSTIIQRHILIVLTVLLGEHGLTFAAALATLPRPNTVFLLCDDLGSSKFASGLAESRGRRLDLAPLNAYTVRVGPERTRTTPLSVCH